MVLTEIKYPHMRDELIECLRALSDKTYQEAVWVRGEPYPGVQHDELDYAIHFLYDDTCLGNDPSAAIGWFLLNEAEAESIRNLARNLDAVFTKHGRNLSDEEYIGKPEWPDVLRTAASCKDLLLGQNPH